MIRAGQLRHIAMLRKPGGAASAYSTDTGGYVDVETIRVGVQPLRGKDLDAAKQTHPETQYKLRCRYRADIKASWQLVIGGQTFQVVGHPIDPNFKKRELELLCKVVG